MMKSVTLPIEKLFYALGAIDAEEDIPIPVIPDLFVRDPFGDRTRINFLVKKTDNKIKLKFGDISIHCGEKHVMSSSNGLGYAIDINDAYNVITDDYIKVDTKTKTGYGPVYDIAIDDPHLYVTPNGFVHHNTTLAKALCNEMGLDYLLINASENGNIDTIRTTIRAYASTMSFTSKYKVVILDEADYLNAQSAMPALRGFIEEFSKNCRFIFTANYLNRIIEPLRSRCPPLEFTFTKQEKQQMIVEFDHRIKEILKLENVDFDKKELAQIIIKYFPDFRRIINVLQHATGGGELQAGTVNNINSDNIKLLFSYLKDSGQWKNMRKWVVDNSDVDSNLLFRSIYDNAETYVMPSSIPQLVLTLSQYEYRGAFVADKEINTTAALTELMAQCEFK